VSSFDAKHVYSALRQSLISNFGDTGWGAVGGSMSVKYFSPTTHLCILRVARDQHTLARGAVTLLTSINGARIIPHVVHVSGTIKHVQLAAIKHNRQVVARLRVMAKTPAQYQAQDSYEAYLGQSTREIEALQD
jgi:ribonuclease P/MRP protein subunit POP5